jgi:hypothetical protein
VVNFTAQIKNRIFWSALQGDFPCWKAGRENGAQERITGERNVNASRTDAAPIQIGVRAEMTAWPDQQTDNPVYAAERNFYKVGKWKDGASCFLRRSTSPFIVGSSERPHAAELL